MEKTFIGIDISKLTLDFCVKNGDIETYYQIENTAKAIKKLLKQFDNHTSTIVAMENTGRYNIHLYDVFAELEMSVYVINPLHLKKSIGLLRGKNDKIDSKRIRFFIEKNYMDIEEWKPNSKVINQLNLLNTERRYRVKIKVGLQNQLHDLKPENKDLIRLNKQLILSLNNQIKIIENKIVELINSDVELKDKYERIQTIPGVGKVLATLMLIKTKGFTDIKSARKMACYAGVAPFEHRSGSSIYYKPRVSTMADKELKKVLHLAALSTIRLENDLARFYKRKVLQGKNKMTVLNAIRNKIIHRIYAVIKNNSVYNFNLQMS